VSEKRGQSGKESRIGSEELPREGDGRRALEGVEQQGQRRGRIATRSKHIGRADAAGADLSHIALAECVGEEKAERDRAQQVADDKAG
jgi:hypothetical protein